MCCSNKIIPFDDIACSGVRNNSIESIFTSFDFNEHPCTQIAYLEFKDGSLKTVKVIDRNRFASETPVEDGKANYEIEVKWSMNKNDRL